MSTFVYTAFDAKGKEFSGQVKEKSWTQALRRVKEMGLFPTSVKERRERSWRECLPIVRPRVGTDSGRVGPSGTVRPKTVAAFTRQLATLLEAGIPLLRSLRATREQEESRRFVRVLDDLIQDIESGCTFSEALGRHPKIFSRIYLKLVLAGEASGMLESTLARLADFMERTARLRAKIKAALIYPSAVLVVTFSILTILSMFVIPRFKAVFADLRGSSDLPAFTQYVLNSSQIIKDNFFYVLAGVAALVMAYKLAQRHRTGRMIIDRFKLKLPVLGRIIRKISVARFARTLGTMLQNGVPVLQALMIARDTTSNAILAQAVQQTHDRVQDGESLTAPLQASGVFPATVLSMIDVGEQTGALPDMLLKVADNYEADVDRAITAALSLLEPALIIFLAFIVGAVVIALFWPIIIIINDGFDPPSAVD